MTSFAVIVVLSLTVVVAAAATARLVPRGRAVVTAIIVWQTAAWSLLASAVLSIVLVVAGPAEHWLRSGPSLPFGELLAQCHHTAAVMTGFGAAHPNETSAVMLGIGCVAGARLVLIAVTQSRMNRSERSRHLDLARIAATHVTPLPGPGRQVEFVIPSTACTAFCIPGSGAVVISEGAVRALTALEHQAVLAHEQSHLRGRHHLMIASVATLCRAFPFVRLFRLAEDQIRSLVEMRADDAAARQVGRAVVASALQRLTAMSTGGAVLAANDGLSLDGRLSRMRDERQSGAAMVVSLMCGGVTLMTAPLLLAAALHTTLC